MTRLRKQDRETIRHVLLERGMKKSDAALKALKLSTATEAYNRLYDADTQTRMSQLPDGWLPTYSTVRLVYTPPGSVLISIILAPLPREMRFLATHTNIWHAPELTIDASTCADLETAVDANEKKRATLQTKISGVLASVSTWKKLYEVWPAARNVLVKLEPANADNLPAIIPQDLSDELELP